MENVRVFWGWKGLVGSDCSQDVPISKGLSRLKLIPIGFIWQLYLLWQSHVSYCRFSRICTPFCFILKRQPFWYMAVQSFLPRQSCYFLTGVANNLAFWEFTKITMLSLTQPNFNEPLIQTYQGRLHKFFSTIHLQASSWIKPKSTVIPCNQIFICCLHRCFGQPLVLFNLNQTTWSLYWWFHKSSLHRADP